MLLPHSTCAARSALPASRPNARYLCSHPPSAHPHPSPRVWNPHDQPTQRPQPATERDMTKFHADDYVQFLKMITPQNMHDNIKQLQRFNVGEDCPVFDGLYDFCQLSAGGSIGGAVKLNMQKADVAVNWAGGLHHAKKCEARSVLPPSVSSHVS